jgi:hypothetical protein
MSMEISEDGIQELLNIMDEEVGYLPRIQPGAQTMLGRYDELLRYYKRYGSPEWAEERAKWSTYMEYGK